MANQADIKAAIAKSRKFSKAWGPGGPQPLVETLSFLCTNQGFTLDLPIADPHNITFRREVGDGLLLDAWVARQGEHPEGVFNFDAGFMLCSAFCHEAELSSGVRSFSAAPFRGAMRTAAVFSISLSHLKWNAKGGDANPSWLVSELPEHAASCARFAQDWLTYASPILDRIRSLGDAIAYCDEVAAYRKNSWVRSDGFRCASLDVDRAFLLVQSGAVARALDVLADGPDSRCGNAALLEQHSKARSWIQHRYLA